MDDNTIAQGDCLDALSSVPDNYFQMAFADPPFNLKKKYASYKDQLTESQYLDWCESWIREMVRVTKPSGSIFLHNIPKWLVQYIGMLESNATFRHWIAWDAPSSPMGKSLQPAHYGVLYYAKDPDVHKMYELRHPHKRCRSCKFLLKDYGGKKNSIHPFGPLISDVWTDIHRCKHDRYRDGHPCQLPIHLMERLILLSTDEGDAVLDCFMGTGTTAIAAKRLGRKYYGMELSQEYVDIANSKLKRENAPSKLGSIWASCYLNQIYTVRDCDVWDTKAKSFRVEWQSLFDQWPDTESKVKLLNQSSLDFKDDIKKLISSLCNKLE